MAAPRGNSSSWLALVGGLVVVIALAALVQHWRQTGTLSPVVIVLVIGLVLLGRGLRGRRSLPPPHA